MLYRLHPLSLNMDNLTFLDYRASRCLNDSSLRYVLVVRRLGSPRAIWPSSFLAFQYPVEIPGVNSAYFLRSAVNEVRKHRGDEELDAMNFLKAVKAKMKELGLSEDFLRRPVNSGFSGGEKNATKFCK